MVLTRNSREPRPQRELLEHSDQSHVELSHHGDFDAEQAEMLQGLASDEAGEPGSHTFNYPDTGANGMHMNGYDDDGSGSIHSNGVIPAFDFAYNAAYTYHEAVPAHESALNPVELLESLSSYEHPSSSNIVPISNNHFASLLQAAATAGGEDSYHSRSTPSSRPARQYARSPVGMKALQASPGFTQSSRKRGFDAAIEGEPTFVTSRIASRRLGTDEVDIDEEAQLRLEHEIWGPEEIEDEDIFEPRIYENPPVGASDARALGVHSAAALFRRPSRASKKYTRPPMSKLFTSLELAPGIFLHLQAAAKAYMLDPRHPERSESVGNKGKSDTDMVKLKLFGCVADFLDEEGWGEKCFGKNSDGSEYRKLQWPAMKNKIIALVTPLLRRMVTNERQRKYALETRNAKSSNHRGGRITSTTQESQTPEAPPLDQPGTPETSSRTVDPKLNNYHYMLEHPFNAPGDNTSSDTNARVFNSAMPSEETGATASASAEAVFHYHVNFLTNGRRIRPKLELTPASCSGFRSLIQHVINVIGNDDLQKLRRLQVLSVTGLVEVADDETWLATLKAVKENEWMEGDVKIIVEVED